MSAMIPGGFEAEGYSRGFSRIAGLDEVGRGPLAGPVVAAAVILPRGVNWKIENRKSKIEIRDSKLLSSRQREVLATWIKENAIAWGLGMVASDEIDRMNILNATLLAMADAVRQLEPAPDYLLIDGPHQIPWDHLRRVRDVQAVQDVQAVEDDSNDLNNFKRFERMPFQRAIVKGDQICLSIAAASIVAKVARDKIMEEYDRLYPEYGFGRHKGYGSPQHLAALRRYGPSPIHRRGFRPVRELLRQGKENSNQEA